MTENPLPANQEEIEQFVIERTIEDILQRLSKSSKPSPLSRIMEKKDSKLMKDVLKSVTAAIESGEGDAKSIIYDEVGKSFYERGIRDAVEVLLKGRGINKIKIQNVLFEPYKKTSNF